MTFPGCDIQCKVLCPLLEETMVTSYCRVHTLGAWVSPEAHPAAPTVLPNCTKGGLNPGACGMWHELHKDLVPWKKSITFRSSLVLTRLASLIQPQNTTELPGQGPSLPRNVPAHGVPHGLPLLNPSPLPRAAFQLEEARHPTFPARQ